ncbi:hypothetical protein [Rhizobium leguminosarum]|jgi:hypothetical protein
MRALQRFTAGCLATADLSVRALAADLKAAGINILMTPFGDSCAARARHLKETLTVSDQDRPTGQSVWQAQDQCWPRSTANPKFS